MHKDDYIPPYSKQFAYRVSKIKELRDQQELALKNDIVRGRENGSLLTVSADESKLYHHNRTFGLVRPLSVGRNRTGSQSTDASLNAHSNSGSESRNRRSQSAERYRDRNEKTSLSSSLSSKNAIEFKKALQLNKDIAAEKKLRESLLQVKKEAYVKYLRDKIDQKKPSWIPSGEGAKHTESMHKSINRVGLEKGLVQKAWRRSPWPGLITTSALQNVTEQNVPLNSLSLDSTSVTERNSPSKRHDIRVEAEDSDIVANSGRGGNQLHLNDDPRSDDFEEMKFVNSLSSRNRSVSPLTTAQLQPLSSRRDENGLRSSLSMNSLLSTASSPFRKRRGSGHNLSVAVPTHVAVTVRLINASKTAHSFKQSPGPAGSGNSYGILTVKASCSRAELIGAIERQFGVQDQISDISIASKYGYSGVLTFSSLSLGTIGEQVELNDTSEVNVYLGGTLYQEGDNNRFLHFLEDELTHYEGKYSSYHVRGDNKSPTRSLQRKGSSSTLRSERNTAEAPSTTMSTLTAGTAVKVRDTSSQSNVRINIHDKSSLNRGNTLHQLELQQHVNNFGVHSPKNRSITRLHSFSKPATQLPVPYQMNHDCYSDERSNTLLDDIPDEDTLLEDDCKLLGDEENEYASDDIVFSNIVVPMHTATEYREEEHREFRGSSINPVEQKRDGPRVVDLSLEGLMPSARKQPQNTMEDVRYTTAQKSFLSPYGQQSIDARTHTSMRYNTSDYTMQSTMMETPSPVRTMNYHHPVDISSAVFTPNSSSNNNNSVNTDKISDNDSRRGQTRADSIHEKILHRVATPTYRRPSVAAAAASTVDYSFESTENSLLQKRVTHNSVLQSRHNTSAVNDDDDDDDDTYLLRDALNAKQKEPVDMKVAQFAYAALASPALLPSSFHHVPIYYEVNNKSSGDAIKTARKVEKYDGAEEMKSNVFHSTASVLSQVSPAPSDLVLNSYVQSILSAGMIASSSTEVAERYLESHIVDDVEIVHSNQQNDFQRQFENGCEEQLIDQDQPLEEKNSDVSVTAGTAARTRPLAEVFQSALHAVQSNAVSDIATSNRESYPQYENLHIDTSVLSAEGDMTPGYSEQGREEDAVAAETSALDSSSVYGSIILSPDASPLQQRGDNERLVNSFYTSAAGEDDYDFQQSESAIRRGVHVDDQNRNRVVVSDEKLRTVEKEETSVVSPAVGVETKKEKRLGSETSSLSLSMSQIIDTGSPRTAVVTNFLERVQQRRMAKQPPQIVLNLDDLMSDTSLDGTNNSYNRVSMAGSSGNDRSYSTHNTDYNAAIVHNSKTVDNTSSNESDKRKQRLSNAVRKRVVVQETFIDLSSLM